MSRSQALLINCVTCTFTAYPCSSGPSTHSWSVWQRCKLSIITSPHNYVVISLFTHFNPCVSVYLQTFVSNTFCLSLSLSLSAAALLRWRWQDGSQHSHSGGATPLWWFWPGHPVSLSYMCIKQSQNSNKTFEMPSLLVTKPPVMQNIIDLIV